jgi:hypothetical protein
VKQSVGREPGGARHFAMEHRWGQRVPCKLRVRLSASAGLGGAGRLRDVSMSGAFVETRIALPLFARLADAVLPENPSAARETEITAIVVRAERDGVGIEWCDTPAGSICALLGCTTRCTVAETPLCHGVD